MRPILFISAILMAVCGTAQRKNIHSIPVMKNGIYSIKINNSELEADPESGGRIVSLKLNGKNFLTGKEINASYWGSTLWPSPQKIWGANFKELDDKAYAVSIENNAIKMTGRKDPKSGFVFTKEISGNTQEGSFTIKYTIINQSDSLRKVAPWEVTRVYPDGLAFYPKGNGERWGNLASQAEDINGITWFDYQADKIQPGQNKFFSDGAEGWIAQVNEDVIFIKKFPDIPLEKAAPSEAEVEIYTNPQKSYVEIEQQGPYEALQPAASLHWEVTWYIRKLPATLNRKKGNARLVAYVRKMVKAQKQNR